MRQAGRIGQWNDDKGFGFVTPHGGDARAFVHVKAFQVSARRPVVGDLISYDTETDAKGRLTAINVRFAGQRILTPAAAPRRTPKTRTPPMRVPRLTIAITFLLVVIALAVLGIMPAALALAYLLMSVASYLMYAFDKEVAGRARWQRILAPATVPRRTRKPRTPARRIPRLAIALLFLLAVIALTVAGVMPAALALVYGLMSVASYLMYAFDKEVAGRARWRRTPESTLHLLDLLGGWPGGLIAQQVARHKTVKASFQRGFWITVVLNLLAYAVLWRSGIAATWTEWLLG